MVVDKCDMENFISIAISIIKILSYVYYQIILNKINYSSYKFAYYLYI